MSFHVYNNGISTSTLSPFTNADTNINPPYLTVRLKKFTTNIFHNYAIFYNVLFYMCIFPFQLKYDTHSDESIQFRGSKLKWGVCIALHTIELVHAITPLIARISTPFGSDPSTFYHLLWNVSGFAMIQSFTFMLFRQSRLKPFFLKLYQLRKKTSTEKHRYASHILICFVEALLIAYILKQEILPLNFSSLDALISSGLEQIAIRVGIRMDMGSNKSAVAQIGQLTLIFLHKTSATINYTFAIMVEMLVMLTCVSIYQVAQDFWEAISCMENSKSLEFQELVQLYNEMKSVVDELNQVFGIQVLFFMMAAIPYYGIHFMQVFDGDWFQRAETIYFIVLFSSALLLAAEGNRKIQQFPEYICLRQNELGPFQQEKLNTFLIQVTSDVVGLKGFGFFAITFGFLGQVVGLVVTHVIIILQFKNTPK